MFLQVDAGDSLTTERRVHDEVAFGLILVTWREGVGDWRDRNRIRFDHEVVTIPGDTQVDVRGRFHRRVVERHLERIQSNAVVIDRGFGDPVLDQDLSQEEFLHVQVQCELLEGKVDRFGFRFRAATTCDLGFGFLGRSGAGYWWSLVDEQIVVGSQIEAVGFDRERPRVGRLVVQRDLPG